MIVEFLKEVLFNIILEGLEGAVTAKSVCPRAVCFEMSCRGFDREAVVMSNNSDWWVQNKKRKLIIAKCINRAGNVKIFLDTKKTVMESHERFLTMLLYVLGECVHVSARMCTQGIIHLDVKNNKFVLDYECGQPLITDLGLVTKTNTRFCKDAYVKVGTEGNYPQCAIEFLKGNLCNEGTFSWGLGYFISQVHSCHRVYTSQRDGPWNTEE